MTQINFRNGISPTHLSVLSSLFSTWNIEADISESNIDEIFHLPVTEEEKLRSIQLAEEDVLAGRLISLEEMKTRHPRL